MTYEDKTWTCLSPFSSVVEKDVLPGSPVVRTEHFHCCVPGSVPDPGTQIPQAMWYSQKKKTNTPTSTPEQKTKHY